MWAVRSTQIRKIVFYRTVSVVAAYRSLELCLVHEHRLPLDLDQIASAIPHLSHDARAERGNVNAIARIEPRAHGADSL